MRYYTIMNGLRGCYMPDSVYTVAIKRRRDLKAIIRDESEYAECRPNDRKVASFCAEIWRRYKDKRFNLPLVLSTGHYYGVHVCPATRAEYLEAHADLV